MMIKRLFGEERGLALPVVVAVIAVISVLGFTAAYLVESQATMGFRFTGGERALSFAEAGLYKYLWHLNKDSRYYAVPEDEKGDDDARLGVDTPFQDGYYRLAVDPPTADEPVVTIRSTGWAADDPSNRLTIEAKVHKRRFVQSIYLSGEENDPDGDTVWWITGDEVWGPLHTNGRLHIDGDPVFHGPVTYAGSDPEVRWGSHPVYEAGAPEKVSPLVFPPSNGQLKTQAQYQGYYFNGRTCILLDGDRVVIQNRDGGRQTLPLPDNGVIYVDGTNGSKWDLDTGNAFISGTLDGRLTIAAANDIYITGRDPTNFSYSSAAVTGGLRYADTDFDPEGGMTDDMLGLVANRYVRILHHDWPKGSSPYYTNRSNVAPYDITIDAAVFALDWAFEFEDHDSGSPNGVITLHGSITQKYRGAVGTFWSSTGDPRSGYRKNYHHDPRMAYDTPPHFLEPANAGWEIVSWRQVPNP